MKIINDTELQYTTIGKIIDLIMEKDEGDTHYFGQVQVATMEVGMKKIRVQIRYLKRYTEWRFTEK